MVMAATAAIATKRNVRELREVFQQVDDPRSRKPIHCLTDMIFIAICAAICGCDSWTDVESFGKEKQGWLKKFLWLKNGIPSHDTFSRVFAALNDDQMCQALTRWLSELGKSAHGQHIAIDGKTMRRSFDTGNGTGALHLVNAWATELGICFGQHAVDQNSNEITAVPQLLDLIEIEGAIITLDAMHCQHDTAQTIVQRGANYLITVKDNQPTLAADIKQAFIDAEESDATSKAAKLRTTTEQPKRKRKSNQQLDEAVGITRICSVMPVPQHLRKSFPGIRSLVRMYREQNRRQKNGEVNTTVLAKSRFGELPQQICSSLRKLTPTWL